jgi:hypothetical protein
MNIAQREHILLTTHLAESREEMEMFRDGSGPLYEFIKSIGRPMNDCGNKTPLELFCGLALVAARSRLPWIVAHLNELTEAISICWNDPLQNFTSCTVREVTTILATALSHSIACARSDSTFASAPTVSRATRA